MISNSFEPLERIVGKSYRESGNAPVPPIAPDEPVWDETFFSLDRSSLFLSLPGDRRRSIVIACGLSVLRELQQIEIAGMTYTAKMSLLSESLVEKEAYSFFASDEASHFMMISSLIGPPVDTAAGGFIQYLNQIIREESRLPLVMLVQVLLEGWGLAHYRALAERTVVEPAREVFKSIIQDEARHHGSGLVIFEESALSATEARRLAASVGSLLAMVRAGPVGVLAEIRAQVGGLRRSDIEAFLVETRFDRKIAEDLALLRALISRANAPRLLAELDGSGAWVVPRAEECAGTIAGLLHVAE